MTVTPQSKLAVSFLHQYEPKGPWVLTAIRPDRKSINTQTFKPGQEDALLRWLEQYNGNHNIYFHVNPTIRDMQRKAEREDMKAMTWLHVDIDPRPGEDIEKEQERALNLLKNPPGNVPPPTCIIFSGGGYQGFWRLAEPVPLDGDINKCEDAKRYNLQLEILFGADNCHNVDRIMRLPGTVNIPDEKKKKKGRKEALAKVVSFNSGRVYPISAFTAAPILQSAEEGGNRPVKVKISGNIERVMLDDLPEKVTDRLKMVIVQGHDPDNPKPGDNSRSAWLFDVICNLIRAGVPDDKIYAIITDQDYGIAASVLDKPRPESYAVRQIERGHEEAIHPKLRELNDRHAVIADIGGKCRIISEVYDHALQRTRISRQTFEDFRNRYQHTKIELGVNDKGQKITMPLGKWWLDHELRRQYDSLVFVPGRTVDKAYNLWKGFACEALPGKCEKFLAHIRDNVCSGNEEHFNYLIGWMARCVQQPDKPGEVAVVLRGKMGTGKGFFAKQFGALWGRHFMQITDPKHLIGNFNSHLRDVVVLFADEAFYAGDNKHASILKGLITEETITIEAKGVDAEAAVNYIHLIMASNNDWVVPAGHEERRFFVLDVSENKMQDSSYFNELREEMDSGGREALLHYLLTYNLKDYDVRKVPQTNALREQKQLSMSLEQQWWYEKLDEGRLLPQHSNWEPDVQKRMLQDDYIIFAQRMGYMRRASPTTLGRFLAKVSPKGYPQPFQAWADISVPGPHGEEIRKKQRVYFYRFASLAEMRSHFDKNFGGPHPWLPVDPAPADPGSKTPF